MNELKRCPGECKEHKPLTAFGKRSASPDGLQTYCKDCRKKMGQKDRARPEKIESEKQRKSAPRYKAARAKRGRDRRAENPGCDSAAATKWVENHPEERAEWLDNYKSIPENQAKISAGQADWYCRNREEKKRKSAQYRIDHADELMQRRAENAAVKAIYDREYAKSNPIIIRAKGNRRRAREKGVQVIHFTPEQFAAKMSMWGNKCWICSGIPEATDHYKPLARGGADVLCNLRPICTSCNCTKGYKWPVPPREELSHLRQLRDNIKRR